ncbi:MAG TPA: class I SAM-dependent methyltransferase [Acidimicrobiales bacterium]|nr:class I SAM-dependent methyltransferase [Acidimicrobiales bacterium]
MAGIFFAEPRLADIYDALHSDRSDLEPFLLIVEELEPTSVVDLGCGTGTLACLLAERGRHVVALDPAAASIAVAKRKRAAAQVRWVVGDASALPNLNVDLVVMSGNVGEHLADDEWAVALESCRDALRPGGHLVFCARDPSGESWLEWNRESTYERVEIPDVGAVEHWLEITDTGQRHFSFRWTFRFESDGATFDWDATFAIRRRDEIIAALEAASFTDVKVRDDEFMFIGSSP